MFLQIVKCVAKEMSSGLLKSHGGEKFAPASFWWQQRAVTCLVSGCTWPHFRSWGLDDIFMSSKYKITSHNQFCGGLTSINCLKSISVKVSSSPDQFHCVQFPAWGIVVACNDYAAHTRSRDNSCTIFIFQCEKLVNCQEPGTQYCLAIVASLPLSDCCSLSLSLVWSPAECRPLLSIHRNASKLRFSSFYSNSGLVMGKVALSWSYF